MCKERLVMRNLKTLTFITMLMFLLALSSIASGQCEPDGNNDKSTAIFTAFEQTFTNWVCPEDTVDFYTFEIPPEHDFSGPIFFKADQTGTTFMILGPNSTLWDKESNDNQKSFQYQFNAKPLGPGQYFVRIGFNPRYTYDHSYTLTFNLTEAVPVEPPPPPEVPPDEPPEEPPPPPDGHPDEPPEEPPPPPDGHPDEPPEDPDGDPWRGPHEEPDEEPGEEPDGGHEEDPWEEPAPESECYPDDNEEPATAQVIEIGSEQIGWLCPRDRQDFWKFSTLRGDEFSGGIILHADPGEVVIQLMNFDGGIIFETATENGSTEIWLGDMAPVLEPGEYFLKLFTPGENKTDNFYILNIVEREPAPDEWDPPVAELIPGVNETILLNQPMFVSMMLDSFYCVNESSWDGASNADEPYFIITGFSTTKVPNVWSTGDCQVFGNVDSGECFRFTWGQRWMGWDKPKADTVMGFFIAIYEEDQVSSGGIFNRREKIGKAVSKAVNQNTGKSKEEIRKAVDIAGSNAAFLLDNTLGGVHADNVGDITVVFDKADLIKWANVKQRPFEFDIDGGSEGHYRVRWHLEFDVDASKMFNAKFTEYDDLSIGNVMGGKEEEIIIAVDDDAPGNDGRFYIYNAKGKQLMTFDATYTMYDRVACGDTDGDKLDEIVVANIDEKAIKIYNYDGTLVSSFTQQMPYNIGYDVIDINNDGKAEILIADGPSVIIVTATGAKIRTIPISGWTFNGSRNTGPETYHDAFHVGDVMGDSAPEIVFIDNQHGSGSQVHIYNINSTGNELVKFGLPQGTFTYHDATCLASLLGDSKLELCIATDQDDGNYGLKIKAFDLTTRALVLERYFPMYTVFDGFEAGDVLGMGRDLFIVATDEDNKVHVGM